MLDFRPKKPVQDWTSRREQRRLLVLVALAGGVLMLFAVARNPQMYAWLTNIGKPAKPVEDAHVDTRLKPSTAARDRAEGLFAVTVDAPADGQADAAENAATEAAGDATTHASSLAAQASSLKPQASSDRYPGVQMEYFRAIKDNTMHRSAEAEAWFHLLGIAENATQDELEAASRGRVTFLQLFRQPDIYRAELVTVAGSAHRVVPQQMPDYGGMSGEYFQVWLQPEGSAHPVVVYALSLPEGFPVELEMKEPVEATGFFFKIWAYAAKDEPRTAPILLAKTLRWKEERVRRTFDRPAAAPPERAKPAAPPLPPRQYVAENWGFTDEVWAKFVDGQAVPAASDSRDDEAATLLKLINNLPRLAADHVDAWAQQEKALAAALGDPAQHRGQFYRIEGRAVRCERVPVPESLAVLFDFEAVWRTEIEPDDGGPLLVVYSSAAPRGWLRGEGGMIKDSATLDERTAAVAMFVKRGADRQVGDANATVGGAGQSRPSLVLASQRLVWRPVSVLGQLGMDMALFDEVVQGVEIGGREAECLYSMLALVPRIDGVELERIAREHQFGLQKDFAYEYANPDDPSNSFVLNEVRSRPEQSAGVAATLSATALQALRVQMKPEDAAKYGFDHYYQINASAPLDPKINVVQQKRKAAAKDGAARDGGTADGGGNAGREDAIERTETLRNDMSVVFCVRRLPEGFPEGEKINEAIRVNGFFYKTWAAASAKSIENNPRARQQYPMFIADSLIWYGESEPPSWIGGAIVAVLLGILVLGGIGALVNRHGNRDLDKTLVRQRTETDAALDGLDVPDRQATDFGFLAEAERATLERVASHGEQAATPAAPTGGAGDETSMGGTHERS